MHGGKSVEAIGKELLTGPTLEHRFGGMERERRGSEGARERGSEGAKERRSEGARIR